MQKTGTFSPTISRAGAATRYQSQLDTQLPGSCPIRWTAVVAAEEASEAGEVRCLPLTYSLGAPALRHLGSTKVSKGISAYVAVLSTIPLALLIAEIWILARMLMLSATCSQCSEKGQSRTVDFLCHAVKDLR